MLSLPVPPDGTDSEQYAEDYGEEEEEEEDEGDKGGASSAPAAAGDSAKPPVSAKRSIRGISAITTAKSALGGRAAARAAEVKVSTPAAACGGAPCLRGGMDRIRYRLSRVWACAGPQIKQLEEQLERQKHRNETLESQMLALKDQLLAVKEKRMQSDHLHYKQSKKLTEAAKLTKEQQEAQAEQHLFQVQKEREEAAAKEAELKELNDGLRKDFNSLMESIPRFMEKRTGEVADEKSVRSTIRQETRDEMKVSPLPPPPAPSLGVLLQHSRPVSDIKEAHVPGRQTRRLSKRGFHLALLRLEARLCRVCTVRALCPIENEAVDKCLRPIFCVLCILAPASCGAVTCHVETTYDGNVDVGC